MSWQGAGWKGGYWKGARTPQRKKTEQNKKSDQAKEQKIPQYDSDCWVVGTSASSSSRPSESAGNLQDLTKVLKTVVKAGNFELPAEAMALLESSERDDTRAAFSTEQRALNARRKAFNKVQRLKDAMGKKTEKYRSFRQAIKDQLATETERYERDMEDIKKNLKLAEAELEKIESGVVDEEMASTTPANEDMDIFGAMDLVKEKDRLQAQLRLAQENSDAKEAKYMETQRNLQHQIQAMQQQMQSMLDHGMVVPTGTRSHVWPAISPVSSQELPGVSSPQMPTVRGAVRPFSRSRDRAEPYLVDNKEMKETTSTWQVQDRSQGWRPWESGIGDYVRQWLTRGRHHLVRFGCCMRPMAVIGRLSRLCLLHSGGAQEVPREIQKGRVFIQNCDYDLWWILRPGYACDGFDTARVENSDKWHCAKSRSGSPLAVFSVVSVVQRRIDDQCPRGLWKHQENRHFVSGSPGYLPTGIDFENKLVVVQSGIIYIQHRDGYYNKHGACHFVRWHVKNERGCTLILAEISVWQGEGIPPKNSRGILTEDGSGSLVGLTSLIAFLPSSTTSIDDCAGRVRGM